MENSIAEILNNNDQSKEIISIDISLPAESISLLKKFNRNIYIDMENKYGLQVSKKTEVLSYILF